MAYPQYSFTILCSIRSCKIISFICPSKFCFNSHYKHPSMLCSLQLQWNTVIILLQINSTVQLHFSIVKLNPHNCTTQAFCLANKSTFSLAYILRCPGIQLSITLFNVANLSRLWVHSCTSFEFSLYPLIVKKATWMSDNDKEFPVGQAFLNTITSTIQYSRNCAWNIIL